MKIIIILNHTACTFHKGNSWGFSCCFCISRWSLRFALHFPSLLPSWFCLLCILVVISRLLVFLLLYSKLFFFISSLNVDFPSSACWLLPLKLSCTKPGCWIKLIDHCGYRARAWVTALKCVSFKIGNRMSPWKGRWKNRHEKQGTHQSYFSVVLFSLIEHGFNVLILETKQKLVAFNFI